MADVERNHTLEDEKYRTDHVEKSDAVPIESSIQPPARMFTPEEVRCGSNCVLHSAGLIRCFGKHRRTNFTAKSITESCPFSRTLLLEPSTCSPCGQDTNSLRTMQIALPVEFELLNRRPRWALLTSFLLPS